MVRVRTRHLVACVSIPAILSEKLTLKEKLYFDFRLVLKRIGCFVLEDLCGFVFVLNLVLSDVVARSYIVEFNYQREITDLLEFRLLV